MGNKYYNNKTKGESTMISPKLVCMPACACVIAFRVYLYIF